MHKGHSVVRALSSLCASAKPRWTALAVLNNKAIAMPPKVAVLFGGRRRDLWFLRRNLHGAGISETQAAALSAQAKVASSVVDIKGATTDGVESGPTAQPARTQKHFSVENPRKILQASPLVWPAVYFELGKGKLSGLVTFTAAASYVVAIPAGMPISLQALAVACTGTALSAMGASAFNQVGNSSFNIFQHLNCYI